MNRLESLIFEYKSLQAYKDKKQKELEGVEQEKKLVLDKISLLEKTQDLLRSLLQKCLIKEVKPIEEFCTYGLKQVFFDLDLSFKVAHKETASDVVFEFKIVDGGDLDLSVEESVGGSVLEVVSFMLRIMLIMRLNKSRFIFMDEFFTGMGAEYRPSLMSLLKVLADKYDFTIVLITHESDFLSGADKVYKVFTGNGSLQAKEEAV